MSIQETHGTTSHGTVTMYRETGPHIGPRGFSQTWISVIPAPGYVSVILDNTAETRRFLRTALRKMEKEASHEAKNRD